MEHEPPRPPRRTPPRLVELPPAPRPEPPAPAPPAELDRATRDLLSEAIARAVAESLGHVRISSVPPSAPEGAEKKSEPPSSRLRESLRYAGKAAAKATTKGGKAAVFASGALSLVGSGIALFMRPEYAAPLAQAVKLIGQVILAAMGGGPPAGDASP